MAFISPAIAWPTRSESSSVAKPRSFARGMIAMKHAKTCREFGLGWYDAKERIGAH